MKIVALTPKAEELQALTQALEKVVKDADVHAFTEASQVLEFAQTNKIDIIVSETYMEGINGWQLVGIVRQKHSPNVRSLFLMNHRPEESTVQLNTIKGFINRPITAETVERAMNKLNGI